MPSKQSLPSVKKTILYYPTITIPTGAWLRQALLYWDELGSIVPEDRSLLMDSPDIEWLKNEHVFRPFSPELIKRGGGTVVDEFKSELLDTVKSADFRKLLPPVKERQFSARVHKDKVSQELYGLLKDRHLAREKRDDAVWYYFEEPLALLYMAKMAKYLAAADPQPTVVGTNLRQYEHLNFGTTVLRNGVVSLTASFLGVLPVPREDVSLPDILDFKRRHADELLNFREMLNEFETKISACKSEVEAKNVPAEFATKVQNSLATLHAALKGRRIPTALGSIESLIKGTSPAWLPALVVAGGGAATIAAVSVSWLIGGAAVAGTIAVGRYLSDRRNERRALMTQSKVSYLLEAEHDHIIE
jgi:hypothetical protein